MNNAFRKSSRRAVKKSIIRFVSLILISFLGACVFAGLVAVSPNMRRAGDTYYDKQNVMDARILSTFGFTKEDVQAIGDTEGVGSVMAGYTIDAIGTVEDKDYTFRLNSLPDSKKKDTYINRLDLLEGKWPARENEVVIVLPTVGLKNISVGSTITLNKSSNSAIGDTLDKTTYTVTGVAESAYYISFMQGSTSIGNGMIDYVLYVPEKNFIVDGYTDLYVTIEGAKERNTFTDEYFDGTSPVIKELKDLAAEREEIRYNTIKSDIIDGQKEYEESEEKVNTELADAQKQLEEGIEKIPEAKESYEEGLAEYTRKKADAEKQLSSAKEELDSALARIEEAEETISTQKAAFAEGERQLSNARAELDNGWSAYNDAWDEINEAEGTLAEKKGELDTAQQNFDIAAGTIESETGMTVEQVEAYLPYMKERLDELIRQYHILEEQYQKLVEQVGPDNPAALKLYQQLKAMDSEVLQMKELYGSLSELVAAKTQIEQGWQSYDAAVEELNNGKLKLTEEVKKLEEGETVYQEKAAEMENARVQLKEAEETIASGRADYTQGLALFNSQKKEADRKFADAKAELDDAAKEIEKGERELTEKQQEFEEGKTDALQQLADAKQEIRDAKQELKDLGEPHWYVLDRNRNESFVNYYDTITKMQELSSVFPVIFFMVAALVCLTTMARMVDEDRTLIGTFKALGYSNGRIAGRYLSYAAGASIIGSVAGVLFGFWLIPTMVWDAYGMVFALPDMTPEIYFDIAALSIASTTSIICLATGVSVKKTLAESPASLMRPKAPKSGQRVFLENIKPIWNRLSFTKKVTVRNLGLNKRRLVMTLMGIVGCTALVVTAFGAKNAVTSIVDEQFGTIFHYNVTVGFNEDTPSQELTKMMGNEEYIERYVEVMRKSAEVEGEDNKSYSVFIVSPENSSVFADYVTFTGSNKKGKDVFTDDSVIVTEKLAMDLGIGVGDSLEISYLEEDKGHKVTITGITENYTFNYVYIGEHAYGESFEELPEYNQFYGVTKDNHTEEEVKTYLSKASDLGIVSFTDDLMGNIKTSINSVDNIIWILIIAAGLLAFVVIYNLTNINVGERQRELATLKVLGFYDNETYSYIYREIIILSIIGCAIGLLGGIFLYRAVVTTVEPDMIFMNRHLTWQGYAGAGALTMFFTWLVNQCMKPRIRNIDMLESLKSVE